jgi:hypothetical protein
MFSGLNNIFTLRTNCRTNAVEPVLYQPQALVHKHVHKQIIQLSLRAPQCLHVLLPFRLSPMLGPVESVKGDSD